MNGEDFRSKIREYKLKTSDISNFSRSRVTQEEEKKMSNALSVKMYLEDHTLGNLLRLSLLKQPEVTYAGYRLMHPLQHVIELKIQTNGGRRSEDSLKTTIEGLKTDFQNLEQEWFRKISEKEKNLMKIEI
ncbi:DNA-directed RNA polymerase II core subunit [Paramecium bursaria]